MNGTMTRAASATAAAVSLGLLGALAALPGVAAATTPVPAGEYQPADDAKAVKGTESSANGPALEAGKIYTDKIGPGDKRYYSVELDGKSGSWISAVAAPAKGTKVAYGDGITIALESKAGEECGSTDADFGSDNAARPISALVGWVKQEDGYCQERGVFNVSVTRTSEATSSPEEWPLELRFMQEPPLAKAGSTTAPDLESIPTTPPAPPNEKAVAREGGTGFNDAAGIDQGVWSDRIRPGETRFYRVPLDWGQQLYLNTEFGTTKVTEDTYASEGVRVEGYNPARGLVGGDYQAYYGDEQAAVPALTPPVAFENRYDSSGTLGPAAFAGWYYIAVSVAPEVGDFAKGPVPVVMRATVKGEPKEGPAYDGDAAAAGFAVTDDDRDAAAQGDTAAEEDSGGGKQTLAFAGIGAGVLLLLGLGGWMLMARRSTPAPAPAGMPAAPGAPTQTAPPNPNPYQGSSQPPYGGPQQPPQPPQNWQ